MQIGTSSTQSSSVFDCVEVDDSPRDDGGGGVEDLTPFSFPISTSKTTLATKNFENPQLVFFSFFCQGDFNQIELKDPLRNNQSLCLFPKKVALEKLFSESFI